MYFDQLIFGQIQLVVHAPKEAPLPYPIDILYALPYNQSTHYRDVILVFIV